MKTSWEYHFVIKPVHDHLVSSFLLRVSDGSLQTFMINKETHLIAGRKYQVTAFQENLTASVEPIYEVEFS